MTPLDFRGMSDDELEKFILTHSDRFDIPGALFEHKHRQDALAAKAAAKLEQQTTQLLQLTDRLVNETLELRRFTSGVFWLTAVLVLVAILQIYQIFSHN
jgi:hypothetical protein